MTRCALTGAGGFVGGVLQRHFVELGWDVVPMIRAADPADTGCIPFSLDRPVDPASLAGTDVLVHGAWDFRQTDWRDIERVNIGGTRALFDAAVTAGVGRLVFISSMSSFSGCRSLYGRAKLQCEAIAAERGAAIVRPGLVYSDPNGGLFGAIENVVRQLPVVPVVTGGRQNTFTCHGDDLARLMAEICLSPDLPDRPVIAAHDVPWTMRTIVAARSKRFGLRRAIVPVPWQVPYVCLRLREMLGMTGTFRSDSVLGLAWQDPAPDFTTLAPFATRFRPYA